VQVIRVYQVATSLVIGSNLCTNFDPAIGQHRDYCVFLLSDKLSSMIPGIRKRLDLLAFEFCEVHRFIHSRVGKEQNYRK
jgi:hypothetical protein